MPVKVAKRGERFRVVNAASGKIEKTSAGKARDGGGHATKQKAQQQANAINRRSR